MNARNLKLGATAGLAGGLIFGAMMGAMGMLPMIGKMVGHPSAVTGFVVHLGISAFIGASFGLLFDRAVRSVPGGLGLGLGYGAAWWVLGPLTLMPLGMGMGLGVKWNAAAAANALPSLVGHLVYGGILGAGYILLRARMANSGGVYQHATVEIESSR